LANDQIRKFFATQAAICKESISQINLIAI